MHYVTTPLKTNNLPPQNIKVYFLGRKFIWGTDDKVYQNTLPNWPNQAILKSFSIQELL